VVAMAAVAAAIMKAAARVAVADPAAVAQARADVRALLVPPFHHGALEHHVHRSGAAMLGQA
jgi:hypothetical protein